MENVLEGVQIITIEMFLITPKKAKQPVPLPSVIGKDGDVFVAWCPIVNVATQGETIEEVVENMEEMLIDYSNDPDTTKPKFMMKQEFFSVRTIPGIKREDRNAKIETITTKKNC